MDIVEITDILVFAKFSNPPPPPRPTMFSTLYYNLLSLTLSLLPE